MNGVEKHSAAPKCCRCTEGLACAVSLFHWKNCSQRRLFPTFLLRDAEGAAGIGGVGEEAGEAPHLGTPRARPRRGRVQVAPVALLRVPRVARAGGLGVARRAALGQAAHHRRAPQVSEAQPRVRQHGAAGAG